MKKLELVVYLATLPFVVRGQDIRAAGGTASFVVDTTVPGISVKGKSTALQAHASIQRGPEGLRLENVEASVPVKSILTGMAVRDEHMRNYIFTTTDGKTPDLRFESPGAACAASSGRSSEFTCQVSGTLTVRGLTRPFSIPLKVHADNSTFRAAGVSIVKLSDYGIEQPTQFGVKTSNEIELRVEFTGKEAPATTASRGNQ